MQCAFRQWPVAAYTLAGGLVLAATYVGRGRMNLRTDAAAVTGGVLLLLAAALLAWSYASLGRAVSLWVQPEAERLVVTGPYRFVRHPAYLGMLVAFIGIALAARSWLGLLSVFVFMGPGTWLRAANEERMLRQRFGETWVEYASRTGSILPGVGKVARGTGT